MTETGRKALAALSTEDWSSVEEVARAIRACQRKTRAALVGSVAVGLAQADYDPDRGIIFQLKEHSDDDEPR